MYVWILYVWNENRLSITTLSNTVELFIVDSNFKLQYWIVKLMDKKIHVYEKK